MGESSRRDRSRSRSPSRRHKGKHRERDRDRSPSSKHHHSHHKSSRHHDDEDRHRKHKKDRERDETEEERKERKRLKKEKKRSDEKGLDIVDDDYDESMWVEKGVDGTEAASNIPTSDSLALQSNPSNPPPKVPLPPTTSTGSQARERESWMLEPLDGTSATVPKATRDISRSAGSGGMTEGYGEEVVSNRNLGGGMDFFEGLGTIHERKDPKADLPDPSKLVVDKRFELNTQLLEGKQIDDYETTEKKVTPGGPGYQWRMMKLKRLYEQAEEQGREVEDVAMERYGNMEDFQAAIEERRILDEREARRKSRRGPGQPGSDGFSTPGGGFSGFRTPDTSNRRFMFTQPSGEEEFGSSRPSSRGGFRRPQGDDNEIQTPSGAGAGRVDELRRRESGNNQAKVSTPVPSVFTPTALTRSGSGYPFNAEVGAQAGTMENPDPTSSKPPLTTEQLNKLQAKVIRAKLMDEPNALALEEEYERERNKSEQAKENGGAGLWSGNQVEVQVLPTLDGRGKLYDVGLGASDEGEARPGNRRKKVEKFETRDREGNVLRYNADDDTQSLGELVRQEKFGAGSGDQKNMDAEMAAAITRDAKFESDVDYMDDNVDKLARRKMKSDAMKRAFAINDYARTKKALDTCPFCYQDDRNPLAAIVALGTRTYMCCTQFEELVPGHCLIVPIQHHLSMLEMDDDDWEEVRNFMKCLMRMHAQTNHGVIFFETVLSFKYQKHTYIEAIPVPFETFQDLPAYFRESIMSSEGEWTQHKKIIDFSTRSGGFRRMMVPNLPYFMCQWDYKGEKGYGHVIEGVSDSGTGAGKAEGEDKEGDVGGAGGKEDEFPRYFAAEVIGNVLGLEPRKWRKPRKIDYNLNKDRARKLGEKFQPFNWTVGQGT
uniref:Cell cycle control protein cwf19 n=1 Tax=Kwoniella bestiolae CBS 10118 TaxID=1296100 RepID=A0A1B9GA22_9TREE|nr:cell cycle control protein cwf19 [Kwoniella bestiolae CBS 10118]OCF27868.1 cell cycle control protein cwf19 [Kwoniella bestiolae CBS 10118]